MRSFKIYGIWSQANKQASIYTYVHNTVMLVWGSLRLTQISTPGQSSLDPPLNPSQPSLDPPLDPPLDPGQSSLDSGQPPLDFVDGLTGTTVAGRKYRIAPNFRGAQFLRFSRIRFQPRKLSSAKLLYHA